MSPVEKRMFIGFDGYVDLCQKVVRNGNGKNRQYFKTIAEYGQTLASRSGKNGDFELVTLSRRAGGNAPIMALAAAHLGLQVDCVACMGKDRLEPTFEELTRAGINTVSIGDAGISNVMEFEDGKLMFGETPDEFQHLLPLLNAVGEERLKDMLRETGVVALVDYANLPDANALWRRILELVQETGNHPLYFLDLADISHQNEQEKQELAQLIRDFPDPEAVHLGLNRNEADQFKEFYGLEAGTIEELAEKLHKKLGVNIIIHTQQGALFCGKETSVRVPTFKVEKQVANVGAGDHFNAGYCTALLYGLEPKKRLEMACKEASRFIATGKHPVLEDVFPEQEK